jgi:ATP-dependent Lhr-like helicase
LREGAAAAVDALPEVAEPLAAATAYLRDQCGDGLGEAAALQIAEFVLAGAKALGCVPSESRVVLERFFDEAGGTQLVVHAPFGSRINRAWGLALRKRFCVGFGFELQAAANEEAIVLSLGPQHSFPLAEVFDYLHPKTAREVLIQAVLASPMFGTRWRWNSQRSLLLDRSRNGKRVPAALLRMRAEDLLVQAFPQVLACPETLPGGPLPVPDDHPIVRQTVEDCLTEPMDVDGFLEVLQGLRDGSIERRAIDTPEPSSFARGILASQPYTFLDDAPLEERRTQAVMTRRILDPRTADELGALDPEAVARVREEAWPHPENAEEVHEALGWMGYVTAAEAEPWNEWLATLLAAGRVVRDGERFFAVEATREPKAVLRGRLEALGPIRVPPGSPEDALLRELETEGAVMRTRLDGAEAWCDRRLLARIQRYTLDRLRREIEPVTTAQFHRFLACWQRVDPEYRADGPAGVAEVIDQLAGFEAAAAAWEGSILPARVRGYRREWLDQLTLGGEVAWGRFWGAAQSPVRRTPVALVPRADLETWSRLAAATARPSASGVAEEVLTVLRARGAIFVQELGRLAHLPMASVEEGLGALVAQGRVTCDSWSGLRWLLLPGWRRKNAGGSSGRWSLLGEDAVEAESSPSRDVVSPELAEFVARRLLKRTGVIFRRSVVRERIPVPWRDVARACRRLEARGEIRGGRFVAGFDGEQYALPDAVALLRKLRRLPMTSLLETARLGSFDPLNFGGPLTPETRAAIPIAAEAQAG